MGTPTARTSTSYSTYRIGSADSRISTRSMKRGRKRWIRKRSTEIFIRSCSSGLNGRCLRRNFQQLETKTLSPQEHVIRLITRLLFVWFLKEKGLVAEELFEETDVRDMLKDYDRGNGDCYYRAVLQNLFFATLNTEIEKREFSTEKNATHRDFSRYRFKKQINDPAKLLELFAQTPFINGGTVRLFGQRGGNRTTAASASTVFRINITKS